MNDKQNEVLFIEPGVEIDARPISLEELRTNERGEPLTWGATPLILTPEIQLQQADVREALRPLFKKKNVPIKASKRLIQYIDDLNTARTFNREEKNKESFLCRRKNDLDDMPFESIEMLHRAAKGHASPAELLYLADGFGIPSIEIASLTHPFGQRMQFLEPMRDATNNAIEMMGGILADETPTYEVKGANELRFTEDMKGLHMTRKTLMGILPNGFEVVERSSFVIVMKHLPEHIATAICAIPYGKDWAEMVLRIRGFGDIVSDLLEQDEYEKAIPVSTTIVAMHEGLSNELQTEAVQRARQRQLLSNAAAKNLIKLSQDDLLNVEELVPEYPNE